MKNLILGLFVFISLPLFSQQMTAKDWEDQSKTDKRLLPKYGDETKSDAETAADKAFIDTIMSRPEFKNDPNLASDHLVELGFAHLYRGDFRTAMYRFNQAWLLDSTNTDIYWGYGAVYMSLGIYDKARKQYEEGLAADPENTHLLTDFGTFFLFQYYEMLPKSKKKAIRELDTATTYLSKSFKLDARDQNTSYKLAVCYWIEGDCANAWKYFNICKSLGGQPITEDFAKDMEDKCGRKK